MRLGVLTVRARGAGVGTGGGVGAFVALEFAGEVFEFFFVGRRHDAALSERVVDGVRGTVRRTQ